jgi:hypothetical protein
MDNEYGREARLVGAILAAMRRRRIIDPNKGFCVHTGNTDRGDVQHVSFYFNNELVTIDVSDVY